MSTLAVVEDFNVLRDFLPDLVSCFISAVVHELVLQGPPETLHRRVVIAVSPTRPRGFDRHARNTGSHDRSYEKPWCGALGVEGLHKRTPQLLAQPLDPPDPSGEPRHHAIPPGEAPVRTSGGCAHAHPGWPFQVTRFLGAVSRGRRFCHAWYPLRDTSRTRHRMAS
jgi:hypothetical protein